MDSICDFEGCRRVVMSKTGRTKCREHHRITVVWKNASNQRNNQCVGFAEPVTPNPRTKQMTVAESGDHLMSLLRQFGVCDIAPVMSLRSAPNFRDLCAQYGGVPA